GACFLYRRRVHEALGGYDEAMYLMEDYDFWLRAARRFRFAWLDRDLYRYRWHSQSLTLSRAESVRAAHERLLERHLPHRTWARRRQRAREELAGLLPAGTPFILVDENQFGDDFAGDRRPVPFLERDGEYWGPPPDDATALREFERLRRS